MTGEGRGQDRVFSLLSCPFCFGLHLKHTLKPGFTSRKPPGHKCQTFDSGNASYDRLVIKTSHLVYLLDISY